jgi:hypothetical protein
MDISSQPTTGMLGPCLHHSLRQRQRYQAGWPGVADGTRSPRTALRKGLAVVPSGSNPLPDQLRKPSDCRLFAPPSLQPRQTKIFETAEWASKAHGAPHRAGLLAVGFWLRLRPAGSEGRLRGPLPQDCPTLLGRRCGLDGDRSCSPCPTPRSAARRASEAQSLRRAPRRPCSRVRPPAEVRPSRLSIRTDHPASHLAAIIDVEACRPTGQNSPASARR